MWIVFLALKRPYTIAVSVALLFLAGYLCLHTMLVDIFPAIDIPVVNILWNYPGLSAPDIEGRVNFLTERAMSTTVSGISKIESTAIPSIGLLRVYFEDGTDMGEAIAQVTATCNQVVRNMPPGMTPPGILKFNASSVPIAQLTFFSDSVPEEKIYDYAYNFLRLKLFTIPGLSTPAPYGGKTREINIDTDSSSLQSKGLSSSDIVTALSASNIILPAGTARIGTFEYNIFLNSSPQSMEEFRKIPVKVVNGAPVTIGDVAKVEDAYADQENIVRINGKRSVYLNLLRKANSSTLTVVNEVKKILPDLQALAPKGINLRLDFDQSVFVTNAIHGVLREGLISGILVSLMVLLFLGSWRSVIIVCTSIPAAMAAAIIGLKLTGNSINIMTLGGLSLAIGMLVDDATVEIENIHRNRNLGKPLTVAILDGAKQIALPAIMATLAICVVFFPVILLTGPARFLFIPMALSVVFSMLASYVLSRTLVPLLSRMLLPGEAIRPEHGHMPPPVKDPAVTKPVKVHNFEKVLEKGFVKFEAIFEVISNKYANILHGCLKHRHQILWGCLGFVIVSLMIPLFTGTDFFPSVDAGLMKLHFRAIAGTRVEETERQIADVEKIIRGIVPKEELETINSMIGVPTYFNLGFVPTDNSAPMDAEVLVALAEDHHPTVKYMKEIRKQLATTFPGASIYFQPADIINQVLNFGLSAPIDVQVQYTDIEESHKVAQTLVAKMRSIAGIEDLTIKQVFNYPGIQVNIDRVRAAQVGVSQRDIANSMLISLSSSVLVAPSFYLNPQNRVNYNVVVKTPLSELGKVEDVLSTPVTKSSRLLESSLTSQEGGYSLIPSSPTERLGNLGTIQPLDSINLISHNAVQRVVDITASVEGRDLGGVISDIQKAIKSLGDLKQGMVINVRGQGEVMHEAFTKLGLGLIIAILLVYLLMVVLFQSWLDPFIVMVAVPGALCGILWMLLITGTTINVESFMGAIMAVGIAASNSILLVSFANEVRIEKNLSPLDAAFEAGKTRLRPVMMTALAMVIGMFPAALALGEGGEQNAPLGRAVIGGLLVATMVTLIIVPIVYSILRTELPTKHLLDERLEKESEGHV